MHLLLSLVLIKAKLQYDDWRWFRTKIPTLCYFEYMGDKQRAVLLRCLHQTSHSPSLRNVSCVTGLTACMSNIGDRYEATLKLNLSSSSPSWWHSSHGYFSGLTTYLVLCAIVGGLMALFNGGDCQVSILLSTHGSGTAKALAPALLQSRVDGVVTKRSEDQLYQSAVLTHVLTATKSVKSSRLCVTLYKSSTHAIIWRSYRGSSSRIYRLCC